MTAVHIIPCLPLPQDIEHDDCALPGETVTWTTEQRRDDCPLCSDGRCSQKVLTSIMGSELVIHGTRTQ